MPTYVDVIKIIEKRKYVYLYLNGKRLKRYPKTYPAGTYNIIGYGLRQAKRDAALIRRALSVPQTKLG